MGVYTSAVDMPLDSIQHLDIKLQLCVVHVIILMECIIDMCRTSFGI